MLMIVQVFIIMSQIGRCVCEPVRGRFVVGHTARQAFGLLLFQSKTTNFLLLFFGALSLA